MLSGTQKKFLEKSLIKGIKVTCIIEKYWIEVYCYFEFENHNKSVVFIRIINPREDLEIKIYSSLLIYLLKKYCSLI